MTIADFRSQTNEEQAHTLRKYGVFLAERFCSHTRIYLYALSAMYIELFQDLSELENAPIRILSVFDDTSKLEDYLNEIDISDLVPAW